MVAHCQHPMPQTHASPGVEALTLEFEDGPAKLQVLWQCTCGKETHTQYRGHPCFVGNGNVTTCYVEYGGWLAAKSRCRSDCHDGRGHWTVEKASSSLTLFAGRQITEFEVVVMKSGRSSTGMGPKRRRSGKAGSSIANRHIFWQFVDLNGL